MRGMILIGLEVEDEREIVVADKTSLLKLVLSAPRLNASHIKSDNGLVMVDVPSFLVAVLH
jgi:hypothetical protein